MNNCCSDAADIDCYLNFSASPIVSPTPTDSLGKNTLVNILNSFLNINEI